MTPNLTFSIIIPTKNEEEDIEATLQGCVQMAYPSKEILVIDDSTDRTPEIVSRFRDRGVHLITRPESRNACCGARNVGMKAATGDIIVLLNADARPGPDFLQRLERCYANPEVDYVIVRSKVARTTTIWEQYTAACENLAYATPSAAAQLEWSEGFSCRRRAAMAAGYIPGDFEIPFCRDGTFGPTLRAAGFNKLVDVKTSVPHICPPSFWGFWSVRVWRGTFAPAYQYYIRGLPLHYIVARELAKAGLRTARYALLLPAFLRAIWLARGLGRWRATPGLFLAELVQDVGMTVGNVRGVINVWRVANRSAPIKSYNPGDANLHRARQEPR
jgi:glycosyltransferase involved in cell wall biosynthesis